MTVGTVTETETEAETCFPDWDVAAAAKGIDFGVLMTQNRYYLTDFADLSGVVLH